MRKINITLLTALSLFFFSHYMMAQGDNNSADNSPIILSNGWGEAPLFVNCPQTGYLSGTILVNYIERELPNGNISFLFQANGDLFDASGEIWRFIDTWQETFSTSYGDLVYINDNGRVFGPNGEKLRLKFLGKINNQGKLVQFILDPMCF